MAAVSRRARTVTGIYDMYVYTMYDFNTTYTHQTVRCAHRTNYYTGTRGAADDSFSARTHIVLQYACDEYPRSCLCRHSTR